MYSTKLHIIHLNAIVHKEIKECVWSADNDCISFQLAQKIIQIIACSWQWLLEHLKWTQITAYDLYFSGSIFAIFHTENKMRNKLYFYVTFNLKIFILYNCVMKYLGTNHAIFWSFALRSYEQILHAMVNAREIVLSDNNNTVINQLFHDCISLIGQSCCEKSSRDEIKR